MFKKRSNVQNKKAEATPNLDGINPEVYARRWWILSALCVTLLGVMLANSSLNMAIPRMAADLSLSQIDLTWIVNIYTLVFASLLFIAGSVGDRYGRKKTMLTGLCIFILGALYAGFIAQTGIELIISRTVMGIGGAFVMPTTLSVINNTFPSSERARAVAIWGAVAGVGMMFGSVISGVLLEHFTWHSLFYFSGIVAIISFVANYLLVHESRDEKETPIDWIGGIFSSLAIFGVVYGITEAPSKGLTDSIVASSLLLGAAALFCFIAWERKTESPMLDMRLFKNRSFSVSSLTLTLVFLVMNGVFFSMSQFMQLVMGYSPLEASLRTIPFMLPMTIISPMVPSIVKRIGSRLTISLGLLITAGAFVVMSTWTKEMSYGLLLCTMGSMMTGLSLAMTPSTNILMASVPRNRSGMGSAMNDTTRQLGGALGVAILGAIISATYTKTIAPSVQSFPEQIRNGVESSIAVALKIADKLGPATGDVVNQAKTAFTTGFTTAAFVGAIIVFVATLLTFFVLPKHTKKDDTTI